MLIIPQSETRVQRLITPVIGAVSRHYRELLPAVRAMLSVICSMALAERTKPLSVIFEAQSGFGKTAVVQMAFPQSEASELSKRIYRSDRFTPKSFVTHAANLKATERAKVDLLPRIRGKVLITKELAPIFRGREEELRDIFSLLISVLDGKGFTSDSGTCGQRGYKRDLLFNWIGCTTPLPLGTHRLMSQLGTRLLFYELPVVSFSDDQLLEYAGRDEADTAENECQAAVNDFLLSFFDENPVGSVDPSTVPIPDAQLRQLVRWAQLLVAGRAEVVFERNGTAWKPVAAMAPEGPHKVIQYLKDLARGHCLAHDRMEVNDADVGLAAEVAISSIPGTIRPIVRKFRELPVIDTGTVMQLCRVSDHTARGYMAQLRLLGLVTLSKGAAMTNRPDRATLAQSFQWLRNGVKR